VGWAHGRLIIASVVPAGYTPMESAAFGAMNPAIRSVDPKVEPPEREILQRLSINCDPKARPAGHINGAVGIQDEALRSDVPIEIAGGSRDVARQAEAGQCGKSQIGGAPHASLEHAAAPHRHIVFSSQIVNR
jgi:hypothetical protein